MNPYKYTLHLGIEPKHRPYAEGYLAVALEHRRVWIDTEADGWSTWGEPRGTESNVDANADTLHVMVDVDSFKEAKTVARGLREYLTPMESSPGVLAVVSTVGDWSDQPCVWYAEDLNRMNPLQTPRRPEPANA